jgi:hypothetical protein
MYLQTTFAASTSALVESVTAKASPRPRAEHEVTLRYAQLGIDELERKMPPALPESGPEPPGQDVMLHCEMVWAIPVRGLTRRYRKLP